MSIFTNPISAAAGEAEAYIEAVLALLEDREPLGVLSEQPKAVEALLEGVADEAVQRPEAPGKWSMLQVVQHLADSELVWAYRLRLVVSEDRPTLTGYDQDRWVDRLGQAGVELPHALEMLRVLRAANLRLLRSLSPEDLQRAGVHTERGEETVELMVRLYAGHDLVHLRQLARIRAAVG